MASAGDLSEPIPAPLVIPLAASKDPSPIFSVASLLSIVTADMALKKAFLKAGLTFPASLAGMVGLFAGMKGES